MAHKICLDRMFQEVKFYKVGSEIADKARTKVVALTVRIADREARLAEVCTQYALSPADLFALAQAAGEHAGTAAYRGNYGGTAYKAPVRDLPAGVVSALVTESEQVESEREQLRTLELLARNLDPDIRHEISFAELEYLGF